MLFALLLCGVTLLSYFYKELISVVSPEKSQCVTTCYLFLSPKIFILETDCAISVLRSTFLVIPCFWRVYQVYLKHFSPLVTTLVLAHAMLLALVHLFIESSYFRIVCDTTGDIVGHHTNQLMHTLIKLKLPSSFWLEYRLKTGDVFELCDMTQTCDHICEREKKQVT